MKIIFYTNSMSPAGGIERVISKHINFLSKHDILLLTKDNLNSFYPLPNNIRHDSLKINFNLDMKSKFNRIRTILFTILSTSIKLRDYIKECKPDIIYVSTPLNLLEIYFAQRHLKNIMVTEHSSYLSYNIVYRLIAKLLYKRVKVLAVPTTDDSKLYNCLNIKNIYLPNPLSFYPIYSSNLLNKVVLNVGRFTDDKQHIILIKIWSLVASSHNGWKLKIIGQGENESKIRDAINYYNLNDSVLISPVTQEIEKEFFNSSIFLLTSRAEGFGLVLAEAMSLGVPCISFNCPSGPKDIINNNRNGFLIENENLTDFVDKLNILIENYNIRSEMGQNAKIDILKFSEKKISNDLNTIIDKNFKSIC
jgi:glycosyltransferase involved in cell wall biosynthesis